MNQLSQQAMNAIVTNTEDLVEHSLEVLKSKIISCLVKNGIQVECTGWHSAGTKWFSKPNVSLATEYLQAKYFMENVQYLVSI